MILKNKIFKINAIKIALSVSLLNQIVSSGTNFALGLYLVRNLTPHEFGLYGIALSISLLFVGIGNALFLTQMVVLFPEKSIKNRLPYATSVFVIVCLFCVTSSIIFQLFVTVGSLLWRSLDEYTYYCVVLNILSIAYLLKNFFVRHAYNIQKEEWALWINIIQTLTLSLIICCQYIISLKLTVEISMWILSVSLGVSVVAGFLICRLPIKNVNFESVFRNFNEAFQGGRWALCGVLVTWLQSQTYMYITVFILGPVGVGHANAARIFITPFSSILPAINQVILPRLSYIRHNDQNKTIKTSKDYTLLIFSIGMIYVIFVLSVLEYLIPVLLGDQYNNLFLMVIMWDFVLIFQVIKTGASISLQAMKYFREIAISSAVSALFAVITTIIFIILWNEPGAIFGTGVGELILAFLLWRKIYNVKNNN